jgi:hypothetical protein
VSDLFEEPDNATPLTPEERRELLIMSLGRERFTWGSANLQDPGAVRRRYVAALQSADGHDIAPLLTFARS